MPGLGNGRACAHGGKVASTSLIFGLMAVLATAGGLAAQEIGPPGAREAAAPKEAVTSYNGSYAYSIPIEAPDFRGIEPKLKLSYDSARGIRNMSNVGSWLGIGWKLEGISAIERVSGSWSPENNKPKLSGGRGSPAYRETQGLQQPADSFMLDDDELIACSEVGSATTSPSCTTTGDPPSKYTSRVENYLRIRRNTGPANSWEVTAKDGTVYSYTALDGGTSATAFRWYLASVTDLHDNHVDYTYSCPAGQDCIISTIKYYNGTPPLR